MGFFQNISNEQRYPRLSILVCFIKDLLIVAGVSLATRLLHQFIRILSIYLPLEHSQPDVESYLPLSVTRSLVTFSDAVAMLAMLIISIVTVSRIAMLSLKNLRGNQ
jgi:hypothetical protein